MNTVWIRGVLNYVTRGANVIVRVMIDGLWIDVGRYKEKENYCKCKPDDGTPPTPQQS